MAQPARQLKRLICIKLEDGLGEGAGRGGAEAVANGPINTEPRQGIATSRPFLCTGTTFHLNTPRSVTHNDHHPPQKPADNAKSSL